MLHDVVVVWPGLSKRYARACALLRFIILNSQHVATHIWTPELFSFAQTRRNRVAKCTRYVGFKCYIRLAGAFIPNAGPTMLGYVVLKCYDRLAGALECGKCRDPSANPGLPIGKFPFLVLARETIMLQYTLLSVFRSVGPSHLVLLIRFPSPNRPIFWKRKKMKFQNPL